MTYYYSTYLTILIIIALIVIGGYESTLRVFQYFDIFIKYRIIKTRMWFMKKKLEKQLGLPPRDWSDFNGKF